MPTVNAKGPALSVVPQAVPVPTPEQRKAIRDVLDGVYDEKLACYLDGHSDQVIAERLKLPMIMVRNLREAAYGPLKSAPEIDALRAEIATLNERAATLQREATAIGDQVRGLGARALALAKHYGIDAAALTATQAQA